MQTTKHSKEERQAHIDAWQQSHLSRKAYCEQHQIKYLTFCSWITKQQPKSKAAESKFIPVQFSEPMQKTSGFATVVFSHCTVQLHERVEASYLQKLIASCN